MSNWFFYILFYLLDEKNELSIFSLFNNELIDSKNVEIKRNDRNEIVELSFNVDKIHNLLRCNKVQATLVQQNNRVDFGKGAVCQHPSGILKIGFKV